LATARHRVFDQQRSAHVFLSQLQHAKATPRNPFGCLIPPCRRSPKTGGALSGLVQRNPGPRTGASIQRESIPRRAARSARRLVGLEPDANRQATVRISQSVTTTTSPARRHQSAVCAMPSGAVSEGVGKALEIGKGGSRTGFSISPPAFTTSRGSLHPIHPRSATSSTTSRGTSPDVSFTARGLSHALRVRVHRHTRKLTTLCGERELSGAAGLAGPNRPIVDWAHPPSPEHVHIVRDTNPSLRYRPHDVIVTRRQDAGPAPHDPLRLRLSRLHADIPPRDPERPLPPSCSPGLFSGIDFGDFLLGLPQQRPCSTCRCSRTSDRVRGPFPAGRLARGKHGDDQRRSPLRILLPLSEGD